MEKLRPVWSEYFLSIAEAVSLRASCSRRKVGAVLVDINNRIIGTGYNGAPPTVRDCLQGGCPRGQTDSVEPDSTYDTVGSDGFCIAIHAEANALLNTIKSPFNAKCYVTHKPCPSCIRLLAGAGVREVYWPGGMFDPKLQLLSLRDESYKTSDE